MAGSSSHGSFAPGMIQLNASVYSSTVTSDDYQGSKKIKSSVHHLLVGRPTIALGLTHQPDLLQHILLLLNLVPHQ